MSADDIVKIIIAAVGILTAIGTALKWAITTLVDALKENTAAIHAQREASVESANRITLGIAEMRAEVRTVLGIRPAEESDDDEPAPPREGRHLTVLRRGTNGRKPNQE